MRLASRLVLGASALALSAGCSFWGAPSDDDGERTGSSRRGSADGGLLAEPLDGGTGTAPADGGSTSPPDPTPGADAGPSGPGSPDDICLEGPNKEAPPGTGNVYYGTRLPTHLPLEADQVMAVVGLGFNTANEASCSGTLISDQVVLTARHCTQGYSPSDIWVIFGVDDTNPALSVRVASIRQHPQVDAALLILQDFPAASIDVRPIPIDTVDLSSADIGSVAEQAGYGVTETGGSDGRYFVAELLAGFETQGDVLVVNGEGARGVCFGDSGGPSMRVAPTGDVRVIGTLSWGDPSCVDRDRYTRVDRIRAWIEESTGPTPPGGPLPCGAITAEGQCDPQARRATYCEDQAQVTTLCTADEVCGWSATANGYRCISTSSAPCGAITAYGKCDGQVLTWCEGGEVLSRDCGACEESCELQNTTVGYVCSPTGCGDLDYLGTCDGDIAVWCNMNGMRQSEDCAARGQTCGWVNNQYGYYCVNP